MPVICGRQATIEINGTPLSMVDWLEDGADESERLSSFSRPITGTITATIDYWYPVEIHGTVTRTTTIRTRNWRGLKTYGNLDNGVSFVLRQRWSTRPPRRANRRRHRHKLKHR